MAMAMATMRKISTSALFRPGWAMTQRALQSTVALSNEADYSRLEKQNSHVTWPKQLNAPLEEVDPEIANIIEL